MSQSLELDDADFGIDPDAPPGFKSERDKSQFTLWFAVLVGAVFILQMALPHILTAVMMPTMSPFGAMTMSMQMPQVGKAFRWNDELWIPVQQIDPGRPPQHRLRVLTADGGWAKDRDLPVPIDVEHALPAGKRLWLISAGEVAFVEDGRVQTIYPRLRLSQFSNPFVFEDDLCIFDRLPDGRYRWLRFSEGEWQALGTIAVPSAAAAVGGATLPPVVWQTETLRVLEWDGVVRLYCGATNQLWTATLDAPLEVAPNAVAAPADRSTDADAPTSAAQPENFDPALLDLPWTSLGTLRTNDWRIVPLDGRLAIVWHSSVNAPFDVEMSASWLDGLDQEPFAVTKVLELGSFGVVAGQAEATVVTDSFPPGGVRLLPLSAAGFGKSAVGAGGGMFDMFGAGYFLHTTLLQAIFAALVLGLVIVGHVLMSRHRDLRYCFGHDTVRLGSLGRRAVARFVDSQIYQVPFYGLTAWMWWTFDFDMQKIIDAFVADWRQALTIGAVIVFGVMTYLLLVVIVMGALEGICGWSPGKLLCGLRVVRTNLRKCGVLRGILRQILLILDGFFNYLVGVAMIGLMAKCQRLGDLVSDTIVVQADSLPEPRVAEETPG
jgi:uncharacterized RDD family membrane protein YckC